MNVILDSCIYYEDPFQKGPRFEALFRYLQLTKSKLYIPKVVYLEILNNYEKEITALIQDIKRKKLIVNEGVKVNKSLDTLLKEHRNHLDKLLMKDNIVLVGHDKINFDEIIMKSVNRTKPFKESGAGLQDATLWSSVVNINHNESQGTCFISNNSKDFGSGILFEDLQEEIEKKDLNRFFYSNDLGEFLSTHVEKINYINHDFIGKFVLDNIDEITNEIDINSIDENDLFISSYDDGLDGVHVEPNSIIGGNGYEVMNFYIYKSTKDYYFLEVEIEIELELDVNLWAYHPEYGEVDIGNEVAGVVHYEYVTLKVSKKGRDVSFV